MIMSKQALKARNRNAFLHGCNAERVAQYVRADGTADPRPVGNCFDRWINSILLVTFANDERELGKSAIEAALSAGFTRMRPVIMTALAMIIGMVPMALGMGDGGEQNAPLGRAVIGDLLFATPTTLFFVPIMYSLLRRKPPMNLDTQIAREAGEIPATPGGTD
jgi:hypothetical protein